VIRIDAHQHFWSTQRSDYGWLTAESVPALWRDYLPDDLAPLLAEGRIDKTVLVQAAETIAETEFLLSLADKHDSIAAVVGWVDFEAKDAPEQIARLAAHPKLKSLRPMMQDMADEAWMLRPALAPAFYALAEHSLAFDALIMPQHLPHLVRLIEFYPGQRIVIDHGAKPYIAAGEIEPWAAQMRAFARHPRVFCKLSGLANEAGEVWDAAKLAPYVDVLIEVFTPSRLMWGSDWPVLTLAGDYGRWLVTAEALTSHLSARERAAIFGDTAASFYGID
jgi:L-fuconolactonase